jgi:hypothetical protein
VSQEQKPQPAGKGWQSLGDLARRLVEEAGK